jgi:hypothetical protein
MLEELVRAHQARLAEYWAAQERQTQAHQDEAGRRAAAAPADRVKLAARPTRLGEVLADASRHSRQIAAVLALGAPSDPAPPPPVSSRKGAAGNTVSIQIHIYIRFSPYDFKRGSAQPRCILGGLRFRRTARRNYKSVW